MSLGSLSECCLGVATRELEFSHSSQKRLPPKVTQKQELELGLLLL